MKTFTVSEQARKGIQLKFNPEDYNELLGVPIGQGILKEMKDAHEAGHPEANWQWLDVVPDGTQMSGADARPVMRLIKEQSIRDKRALVLVETAPGIGGTVKLFANTVTEWFDEEKGRVVREATAFPPPGVELLAEKPAQNGFGPEFLVSMIPGSSFRIVRSGKLYDSHEKKNAAPEIVVLWNGRWDRRAEFDKFRNPDPARFKAFMEGQLRKSDFSKDEWDSLLYKKDPMKGFWGLSVYNRSTRHGSV